MGETHLWRIRYQPTERFRTIDVGRPYVVEDDQLRATEVAHAQRAAGAALGSRGSVSSAASPRLASCSTLRLLNVVRVRAGGGRRDGFRGRDRERAVSAVARLPVPVRAVAAVLRDARLGDGAAVLELRPARDGRRGPVSRRTARALGRHPAGAGHRPDARGRPLALAALWARGRGPVGPCAARVAYDRLAASDRRVLARVRDWGGGPLPGPGRGLPRHDGRLGRTLHGRHSRLAPGRQVSGSSRIRRLRLFWPPWQRSSRCRCAGRARGWRRG